MGLITDIQNFSIHDGPGIRTSVFLKGCPMRCFWCHNPETWSIIPEVQYFEEKCTGCGNCSKICPGVMKTDKEGKREFVHALCTLPENCSEECNYDALELRGKWWSPVDLFNVLIKDIAYFRNSGGGITLTGGEPLLQHEFCLEVLKLCKSAGIHTAIETAAYCKWEDLKSLLPWLDLVIMDIKHMDDDIHKKCTGVSNKIILENALKLNETGIPLLIRTPVVPGINDNPEDIGNIAEFIKDFKNLTGYELMPFHNMATGKYKGLGIKYKASEYKRPEVETMAGLNQRIKEILEKNK